MLSNFKTRDNTYGIANTSTIDSNNVTINGQDLYTVVQQTINSINADELLLQNVPYLTASNTYTSNNLYNLLPTIGNDASGNLLIPTNQNQVATKSYVDNKNKILSTGSSSISTFQVGNSTNNNTVSFIPNNTANSFNSMVGAGDNTIVYGNIGGDASGTLLNITGWSSTKNGLKLTPTTTNIYNGSNTLTLDKTNGLTYSANNNNAFVIDSSGNTNWNGTTNYFTGSITSSTLNAHIIGNSAFSASDVSGNTINTAVNPLVNTYIVPTVGRELAPKQYVDDIQSRANTWSAQNTFSSNVIFETLDTSGNPHNILKYDTSGNTTVNGPSIFNTIPTIGNDASGNLLIPTNLNQIATKSYVDNKNKITSTGSSSISTFQVGNSTNANTVSFIPNNTVNSFNSMVGAGDNTIVYGNIAGDASGTLLNITGWSNTKNGLKLTPATTNIYNGANTLTLDKTNGLSYTANNTTAFTIDSSGNSKFNTVPIIGNDTSGNLLIPTNLNQVATKSYADGLVTGFNSAIALKANIASPTFTGTVSGITSAMVGLDQVNNTSDASKPISTLTQTALNNITNTFYSWGLQTVTSIDSSNAPYSYKLTAPYLGPTSQNNGQSISATSGTLQIFYLNAPSTASGMQTVMFDINYFTQSANAVSNTNGTSNSTNIILGQTVYPDTSYNASTGSTASNCVYSSSTFLAQIIPGSTSGYSVIQITSTNNIWNNSTNGPLTTGFGWTIGSKIYWAYPLQIAKSSNSKLTVTIGFPYVSNNPTLTNWISSCGFSVTIRNGIGWTITH